MGFTGALCEGNLPATERGLRADAQAAQSPGARAGRDEWTSLFALLKPGCSLQGGGLLPKRLSDKSASLVAVFT